MLQNKIFEWNREGTMGTNRLFTAKISFLSHFNRYGVTINGRTLEKTADGLADARKLAESYSRAVMTRLMSGS